MSLKTAAAVFGSVILIIGILGFVPSATPNRMLFGLFHVNAAHNIVHMVTGVIALLCASRGGNAPRQFFQFFGVIYGVVALLGFVVRDGYILGFMANNMADTWLHVAITTVSVYLGFVYSHEGVLRASR